MVNGFTVNPDKILDSITVYNANDHNWHQILSSINQSYQQSSNITT